MAWLHGSAGAALSSVLLHLTWQGAVVALAAGLGLRLVGPTASAARYRIALAALALLALAPALTLARRGGWLARTSPGWLAVAESAASGVPFAGPPSAASIERRAADPPSARLGAWPGAPGEAAGNAAGAERIVRAWRAALPWLLAAWLAGAMLCLGRLAGGIARLHTFHRRAVIAPAPVRCEVERLAPRVGLGPGTDVRISGEVDIPLTFGASRPVVLLPRRFARSLRGDQVRLVLAHELAHVARHDYVVNLAQCLIESLFFFHPAVHWFSRTARQEREHCCDDLAATVAGDRHAVAEALVALEALVGMGAARRLAPAATGGTLLRRVERLVTAARPAGRVQVILSLAVLVAAVALAALATPASARIGDAPPARAGTASEAPPLGSRALGGSASRAEPVTSVPPAAASPDPSVPAGFSVVWNGPVGPGQRLAVRNLVGSVRVVPARDGGATILARVSGGVVPDLVFEPVRDAGGVTVCALRAAYGRCDAEGYDWFGTADEMRRAVIDLVVELPAGAAIAAAGFAGDLVLDGVSGDAEARTGSGAITARVVGDRDDRTLEFHTGAGEVRVALPEGFGGTLQARLSDGAVENEMPLVPVAGSTPQRMRARFGPGGNRLDASSGRGSLVLIRRPAASPIKP